MSINDSDRLLINDGSKTETITISQIRDGSMLNDTDKFLVNDGTKTETITWEQLSDELGPKGTVNKPTVLKPKDGAGSGDTKYLKSDRITAIEGGGVETCETSDIAVVDIRELVNESATIAWSGHKGDTWSDSSTWDGLPVSDGIGNDDGTVGTGSTISISTPFQTQADSWGAGIRGADGWALRFDRVVTIGLPSTGFTQIIACQTTSQRTDQGTVYDAPFTQKMTGQVFWMNALAGNQPAVTGIGTIEGEGIWLEFPDNTDFDCFEVGEVVQTIAVQNQDYSDGTVTGTPAQAGTTWDKAFDGKITIGDVAGVYNLAATNAGDTYNLLFPEPEPINESIQFVYMNESTGIDGLIKVVTNAGTVSFSDASLPNTQTDAQEQSQVFSKAFLGDPASILGFELTGGTGWTGIAGVLIDGKLLTNIKDVPDDAIRINDKDANATPPTVTVDGGSWKGSDGSGDPGGATKLVKQTPYGTELTVAGPTDLDNAFIGGAWMTDGTTAVDGTYNQSPYTLTTSEIIDVEGQSLTTSGTAIDVGAVENLYAPGKANPYAGVNDSLQVGINYGGTFRVNFATPISGNVTVWANWAAGSGGMSLSGNGGAATVSGVAQDGLLAPYDMGTVSGMTYVEIAGSSTSTIWGIVIDGKNINGNGVTLTFADPCPDLQYFKEGDVIQGETYTISTSTGQFGAGLTANFAFDGRTDTYAANSPVGDGSGNIGDEWLEIEFPTPINVTNNIVFYFWGAPHGQQVSINDGAYVDLDGSAESTTAFTGVLEKVRFSSVKNGRNKGGVGAIAVDSGSMIVYDNVPTDINNPITVSNEVKVIAPPDVANRKLTVDGGNWRASGGAETPTQYTVRKSSATTSPPTLSWGTITDVGQEIISFDATNQYPTDTATYGTFIYDLGVTTAEVYWHHKTDTAGITATHELYVSDDSVTWTKVDQGDGTKLRLYSGPGTFRYMLAVRTDFAGMSASNWAIDPSSFEGDEQVTYQTNGGKGDVVSVDAVNYKIRINNTGDRDNRWIAENQAGTDFFVAGPQFVDAPLLTTNVELQSSEFATTPAGVDGLQSIIWNLNGIDQPGTTLNPYRPTGLAINTTYNVKVKHVANSIGESEWSTSTTFTTGNSRSLKEHYVGQIRELEQQLAAAQGTKTRSAERKRARNADGTYRGDDPSTPGTNEAWEDGEFS